MYIFELSLGPLHLTVPLIVDIYSLIHLSALDET